MKKYFFIYLLANICMISTGQKSFSTILIVSEPDEVHVEIPKVPFEIDKTAQRCEVSIIS